MVYRKIDCLLNSLNRLTKEKISKLHTTGLCEGNQRWPEDSPRNGPIIRKVIRCHNVIVVTEDRNCCYCPLKMKCHENSFEELAKHNATSPALRHRNQCNINNAHWKLGCIERLKSCVTAIVYVMFGFVNLGIDPVLLEYLMITMTLQWGHNGCAMGSQITSLTIVYSTVHCFTGADQRKHQSSSSLAFVREIHRWPVNCTHKWPITQKMSQFDDAIMYVIVSAMAPQIASISIVCSTVCSGAPQRKHQSSESLAFLRGIHRWPVDSPHEGPLTGKFFHLMTSSWFRWQHRQGTFSLKGRYTTCGSLGVSENTRVSIFNTMPV